MKILKTRWTAIRLKSMACRYRVRLEALSREELLDIAASGMAADEATRQLAETAISNRAPLPAWAVESVLLDADLIPAIIRHLTMPPNAVVPLTCKAWNSAWTQALREAKVLRPMGRRALQGVEYCQGTVVGTSFNCIKGAVRLATGEICTIEGEGWEPHAQRRAKSRRYQGWLRRYHAASGQRLMQVSRIGNPMSLASDGEHLYVTCEDCWLRKLHPADGRIIARTRLREQSNGVACSSEMVFASVEDKICVFTPELKPSRKIRIAGLNPNDNLSVRIAALAVSDEAQTIVGLINKFDPAKDIHEHSALAISRTDGSQSRIVNVQRSASDYGLCIRGDRVYVGGVKKQNGSDSDAWAVAVLSLETFDVLWVLQLPRVPDSCRGFIGDMGVIGDIRDCLWIGNEGSSGGETHVYDAGSLQVFTSVGPHAGEEDYGQVLEDEDDDEEEEDSEDEDEQEEDDGQALEDVDVDDEEDSEDDDGE